jgi:hypothetical protein
MGFWAYYYIWGFPSRHVALMFVTVTITVSSSTATSHITIPSSTATSALQIANVSAPAVNCVFNPSCTITVDDTSSPIPSFNGTSFIQSRTFEGANGTQAASLFGYEYRISLIGAVGATCIDSLIVWFGPVVALDFNRDGNKEQVYVVTTGGTGDIGIVSAVEYEGAVDFAFASPVCAGHSTFFFGMVSPSPPVPTTATLESELGEELVVFIRSPMAQTVPNSLLLGS